MGERKEKKEKRGKRKEKSRGPQFTFLATPVTLCPFSSKFTGMLGFFVRG